MNTVKLEFDEEDMIALRMAVNELPEKARKRLESRIIFQIHEHQHEKENDKPKTSS